MINKWEERREIECVYILFLQYFQHGLYFLVKDVAAEAITFPKQPLEREDIDKEFKNAIIVYI